MSLSLSRYNEVRAQLVKLYRIISYQTFPVFIAPQSMMSMEELRGRSYYHSDTTTVDHDYYERQEKRHMQIPQIMELIPNLTAETDIGFENPNKTVVTIYESIQEYIALWCELMREAPEFKHPPIEELRALEDVAYLVYGTYSKVKPYLNRMADQIAYEEDKNRKAYGLGGLFALLKANPNRVAGENSFVSHLDELLQVSSGASQTEPGMPSMTMMPLDGIMAQSDAPALESWFFKQGAQ